MEEMPSLLSCLLQEELFRIYRDLSLFLISEKEVTFASFVYHNLPGTCDANSLFRARKCFEFHKS